MEAKYENAKVLRTNTTGARVALQRFISRSQIIILFLYFHLS